MAMKDIPITTVITTNGDDNDNLTHVGPQDPGHKDLEVFFATNAFDLLSQKLNNLECTTILGSKPERHNGTISSTFPPDPPDYEAMWRDSSVHNKPLDLVRLPMALTNVVQRMKELKPSLYTGMPRLNDFVDGAIAYCNIITDSTQQTVHLATTAFNNTVKPIQQDLHGTSATDITLAGHALTDNLTLWLQQQTNEVIRLLDELQQVKTDLWFKTGQHSGHYANSETRFHVKVTEQALTRISEDVIAGLQRKSSVTYSLASQDWVKRMTIAELTRKLSQRSSSRTATSEGSGVTHEYPTYLVNQVGSTVEPPLSTAQMGTSRARVQVRGGGSNRFSPYQIRPKSTSDVPPLDPE
ncbi:hypothetical protein TREMEDRAFT_66333 [Tremella mesenterica DSM 1558]|uniref:uncharacterized protein n=1 Tax=Tremella mesenterica (strain ATCC 24925 / CBS 8224 / DSM 1558 / NBRC 9311 / NRRL Y-6157 / RJB 2259-6 / UBC 559-6) TaxID=578456 RepID=UPI00032CB0E1|nr:uncharacterized protein TREMEDRAFT_66333 [Tremella mesenterica DSM 1558]EIW65610.1 hypothetical protein TREMEDRAFT_66333 [Tremella mesenterica DSM 1558]